MTELHTLEVEEQMKKALAAGNSVVLITADAHRGICISIDHKAGNQVPVEVMLERALNGVLDDQEAGAAVRDLIGLNRGPDKG
ncbi:hypothetical protein KQI63_09795 [bacterium]|nr:hypothetical protein [bacterium]